MAKQWGPLAELLPAPVEPKVEAAGRCTRPPGRVHRPAPLPDEMLPHFLAPRREDRGEAVSCLALQAMASTEPEATELRAVPNPLPYPRWPRADVKLVRKAAVVFLSWWKLQFSAR